MSSATRDNSFYEPVVANRFFSKSVKYDVVYSNRDNLRSMVQYFETRIRDWYIEPIEVLLEKNVTGWRRKIARWLAKRDGGGHYSFTVAAVTCLLVDTLSQFERGLPEGTRTVFKDFLRNNLPDYAAAISPTIDGYRPRQGSYTNPHHDVLADIADVLYSGFRCGILHQAHAPLYCGIVPGNEPPSIESSGLATYGSTAANSTVGGDCPVVIIRPGHLFSEVITYFNQYLKNLCNSDPQHDVLRDNFKLKFVDCFGIDISAARLPRPSAH